MAERQLSLKALSEFCQRLGMATAAGVDLRRALASEAAHTPTRARSHLADMRQRIGRGDELWEAMAAQEGLFPPLVVDVVRVGEQSGTVDRAFLRLSEHFDHLRRMRIVFLVAAAWPALQATLAVVAIAGIILVIPWVERQSGHDADILGFGLKGPMGVVTYLNFLFGCVVLGGLALRALTGPRVLPRFTAALTPLPGLGGYLQSTALSRLAWTLALADETGMGLLPAIELGMRATQNARFAGQTGQVLQAVRGGEALSRAFDRTGVFPGEFIAALEVGEQSGRLGESLRKLSQQYQDDAGRKSIAVAVAGSIAVWVVLGGILIWLIFRVAGFYLGVIEEFLP